MLQKNIIKAAKILFEHKLNRTGLEQLDSNCKPRTIEDAYLIQEELKINYLTLSDNICIGKKVGCTNIQAQKQVGINEPFYGNLFSRFSSDNKVTLKSKIFSQPWVEPEIGIRIREDINIAKAPFNFNDINYLFDGIICSIEIVDFRFTHSIDKIGINNLISTNGASDFWIKSNDIFPIDRVDLDNHPVFLEINNDIVAKGNTKNVLNNPFNSALWLINFLAEKGEIMLKGQYISTGSCTKAVKIENQQNIKADFGSLGTIELKYV